MVIGHGPALTGWFITPGPGRGRPAPCQADHGNFNNNLLITLNYVDNQILGQLYNAFVNSFWWIIWLIDGCILNPNIKNFSPPPLGSRGWARHFTGGENCQSSEIFLILFETSPPKSVTILLSLSQNIPIITILWVIFFCFCFLIFLGMWAELFRYENIFLIISVLSLCSDNDCKLPFFCKNGKKKGSTKSSQFAF